MVRCTSGAWPHGSSSFCARVITGKYNHRPLLQILPREVTIQPGLNPVIHLPQVMVVKGNMIITTFFKILPSMEVL